MTTPKTVLTNAGRAKITNAITLGTPLSLVKIALGSSEITPVATMTTVPNQVWIGNLDSLTVDPTDANLMVARITVPAEAGPFFVRSAGLIDSAGTLIAIASLATMEQVPGGTTLKVSLVISVGADSVSGITLVPAGSFIGTAEKGQPGGVATLDGSGKVPASQLPESPGVGGGMNSANWPLDTETVEPIACAYPLNAEESEILMLNGLGQAATGRATLGGEQSATYTTQGELAEEEAYWVAPSNFTTGTSAKIDLSSGKKAIQIYLSFDEMDEDADGAADITFILGSPSFVPMATVTLGFKDTVSGFRMSVENSVGTHFYEDVDSPRTVALTLELDCDEGTIGVRQDGELKSVGIANTFTPSLAVIAVTFGETAGLTNNADKVLTAEWRTQFSDIEGEVTEGYTDVCGNGPGASVVILPEIEAPALLTVTGETPSVYQGNTYCAANSEDYDPATMFSEALLWDSSLVIPFKRKPGSSAAFSPVNWPMTLTDGPAAFTAADAMYGGTYPNSAQILDGGATVAADGSGIQVAIGQLGESIPDGVHWFAYSVSEVPEEAGFAESAVNFSTGADPALTPAALSLALTTGGLKYKLGAGSQVTFDETLSANEKVLILLGVSGGTGTIFVGTEASIAAAEGALTPLLTDVDTTTLDIYGVLLAMFSGPSGFPYAITVTTDDADLSPAMQSIVTGIDGLESATMALPEVTPVALLKITAEEPTNYGGDIFRAGDYAWFLASGAIRKIYSAADLQALAAAEVVDGLVYQIPLLDAEGMVTNTGYNSIGLPVFSVTPVGTIIKTAVPTTLNQGRDLFRFVPTGSLVRRGEDYWELFVSALEADSAYAPIGSLYDGYVPFPSRSVRPSVAGDAMTVYLQSLGGASGLYEFVSNGNGGGSYGAGAGVRSESGDLAYAARDTGGLFRGHMEGSTFVPDATLLDTDAFPSFVTGEVLHVFLEAAEVKIYRNGNHVATDAPSVGNFNGWRGFLGQFDGRGWNSNIRKFFFNAGVHPYQWVPRAHGYAPISYLYRTLAAETAYVPTQEQFDALSQSLIGMAGVNWPLTQAGEWIGYPMDATNVSGGKSYTLTENAEKLLSSAEDIASGWRSVEATPMLGEGDFSFDTFEFEIAFLAPDGITFVSDYFRQQVDVVSASGEVLTVQLSISEESPIYTLTVSAYYAGPILSFTTDDVNDLPDRVHIGYDQGTNIIRVLLDGSEPELLDNFVDLGNEISYMRMAVYQHDNVIATSRDCSIQIFTKSADWTVGTLNYDEIPDHRGGPFTTILPDNISGPAILTVTSEDVQEYGGNQYSTAPAVGVYQYGLLMADLVTVLPLLKNPLSREEFSSLFALSDMGSSSGGIPIFLDTSGWTSVRMIGDVEVAIASGFAYGNGTVHRLRVRQDDTGGRALALPDNFRKMSDSEDDIQTAPGSYSMVELMSFDGGVRYEYRIIHLAADPD